MSRSRATLKTAVLLAKADARNQSNLHRSISTSYYALFYFLMEECCTFHLGKGRPPALMQKMLCRAFGHEEMKRASQGFANGKLSRVLEQGRAPAGASAQPIHPKVAQVAQSFVALQEMRHAADYDAFGRFTRSDAQQALALARVAMESWAEARGTHDADLYLVALLSGDKLAKR